jgi:hypothetical protein
LVGICSGVVLQAGNAPPPTVNTSVVRKNSCSFSDQSIFMVQSTENRVSYNLEVVWNAVSMFVRGDRKIGWRIW